MENNLDQRVQELIAAGCSATNAATFAATSLTPSEVVKYENAGLVLEHLHDCQTLQIEPLDLRKWLDLLFLSSYVHQVVKMGISLEEAQQIFNEKVEPERSTLIQLLKDGTSVEEILLLRQMGVYFFRTGASKERPLREIFMDSAFGSAAIRKAWELTNASTRQAMIAKEGGVTPYGYVVGAERGSEPPRCTWVIDEKNYQFDSPLPEVFLSSLGRKRNDSFLEAVGYSVGTRNLKSEFLGELNPVILFETKRINGKKFLVGLTFSQEMWHAKFLTIGAAALEVEISGSLTQVGAQSIKKLDSLGYKVRSVTVRPSLKSVDSEYLATFAQWFKGISQTELPRINGEPATLYVAIDGTYLMGPIEESRGRPGTDEVKRFGDLALRFIGTHQEPIVVISDSDDETIRRLTQPFAEQLSAEIFADVVIKRHILREEGNFNADECGDDVELWLEGFDSNEHYLTAEEFTSFRGSESEIISFQPNEVVEIWSDASKVSLTELLSVIRIDGRDFQDFDNGYDWQRLHDIADAQELWFFEDIDHFFLRRPPIFINGMGYSAVRENSEMLLELSDSYEEPWPRLSEVVGQFSLSEWASMTSGTDWDEIGFTSTGELVNCVRLDESEIQISAWGHRGQDLSKDLAIWLLSDDYGHKFKALLFVEGRLGKLPEGNKMFADWLDDSMSSTLEIHLSCNFSDESLEESVLQELLKDAVIAQYAKGITDPDSVEGKRRTKRQEAYRVLHNRE